MKRLTRLVTAAITGICLTACGSSESSTQVSGTSSAASSVVQTAQSNDDSSIVTQTQNQSSADSKEVSEMKLYIEVNGKQLTATLADTAAAAELAQRLKDAPITVSLDEYGSFEKVGRLPWSLTKDDEKIKTKPCDIMLYQENQITIFYGSNSWSYTRLGRIENISQDELKNTFGDGDVTVTLSLK